MSKIDDLYNNKFENLSAMQVMIPQPILDQPYSSVMKATWHSSNTEFLNLYPKYYLFRYKGKGSNGRGSSRIHVGKRFVHPTHQNGIDNPASGWWGGSCNDQNGDPVPPRNTEWEVSPDSGKLTHLDFNIEDYAYSVTPMPALKEDLRVKSQRGKSRVNAYFYLAIGVQIPLVSDGCPVVFGPPSPIFSARPQRMPGGSAGLFDKYCFFIEG